MDFGGSGKSYLLNSISVLPVAWTGIAANLLINVVWVLNKVTECNSYNLGWNDHDI